MMRTSTLLFAVAVTVALPACGQLPAAHVLSAAVSSDGGYDSNRLGTPDGYGSGFVSFESELRDSGFLSGGWELAAHAGYWRREFLASGLSYEDEVDGGVSALDARGPLRLSVAADAGRFRNGDDPTDDARWARLSPAAWFVDRAGREVGLRARITHRQYDNLQTWGGEDEHALAWRLTPNVGWPASAAVLIWAEAYLEGASSNEPEDEYDGVGVRLGTVWTPRKKWRVEGRLESGWRTYNDTAETDEDTRGGTVRCVYRWNPWVDLFSSVEGEFWSGRGSDEGGDRWRLCCGARLNVDHDL